MPWTLLKQMTRFAALGLRLQGAPACPSEAAIRRALLEVGDPAGESGALAALDVTLGGLRVQLTADDGRTSQRTLPASEDCAALAHAAAVTLAIWDSQLSPDARPVVLSLPEADELGIDVVSPRPARRLPPVTLGVSAGGAFAASGVGLAAELLATLGLRDQLIVATASLRFDGPHQATLATGTAVWSREVAGLGAAWQPAYGDFRLALGGEVLAGAIEVDGRSFAPGQDNTGFELGAALGPRLSWTRFRVTPFVGVQGITWFLGQQVHAQGTTATANLSSFELWAEMGCAFRL